jgi:hypothetical protein
MPAEYPSKWPVKGDSAHSICCSTQPQLPVSTFTRAYKLEIPTTNFLPSTPTVKWLTSFHHDLFSSKFLHIPPFNPLSSHLSFPSFEQSASLTQPSPLYSHEPFSLKCLAFSAPLGSEPSTRPVDPSHTSTRCVTTYKNPQLSDLTITYGVNGEKKFTGHRLILCSASEWLMNASKNFSEANEREIIFRDDCVGGIEDLFEFVYTNTYAETNVGYCRYQLLQNRFEQHLRAFATADKYQADAMKEHAWFCVEKLLDACIEMKGLYWHDRKDRWANILRMYGEAGVHAS